MVSFVKPDPTGLVSQILTELPIRTMHAAGVSYVPAGVKSLFVIVCVNYMYRTS